MIFTSLTTKIIFPENWLRLEIIRRVLRNLIMAYDKAGDDSHKDELTDMIDSLD